MQASGASSNFRANSALSSSSDLLVRQPAYLSEIVNLEQEISRLEHHPSPLFSLLVEVKQTEHLPPFANLLTFPEPILDVKESVLNEYDFKRLDSDSPLFFKINYLIDTITSFVSTSPDPSLNTPLTKIAQIYRTYIEDVCRAEGKQRRKLLKGPARLYAHLHGRLTCLELNQSKGRQLVSLDRYNCLRKMNTFGASALQREGNAFIKRAHMNPLDPGKEHAVDALNKLLCGLGSAPSLLIVIDNVIVKDPFNEISRRSENSHIKSIRNLLAPNPAECVNYFHDHPEDKRSYPFLQGRLSYPAQVNLAIEGSGFTEFLSVPDNLTNLAEILDPYSYTAKVALTLISKPDDERGDNDMLTHPRETNMGTPPRKVGRNIVGIDNDGALKSVIRRTHSGEHVISLKSITLLLPTMNQPVDSSFTEHFINKISPETLVIEWLANLKRYNQKHDSLQNSGVLTKTASEELSLPLLLSPSAVLSVYTTITRIQAYLKTNPTATHRELFRHIYPLVHDAYQILLERHNYDPLEVQNELFSIKNPPLLENFFSPEVIKEHLIDEEELPETSIAQVVEHYLKTVLPILSDKKQEKLIRRVLELFPEIVDLKLPGIKFSEEILNRLINSKVKSITLTNAATLTYNSLIHLLNEHPDLHLILESSNLSAQDLQIVIEYANDARHQRTLSYQIGTTTCSLNQSCYNATLKTALLNDTFPLAEALVALGGNLSQFLPQNNTLAHLLAEKGSPASLEFLHRHGIPLDQSNKRKETPLHLAAQAGNLPNVEFLLQAQVSIDSLDFEKRTPLHLATIQGHLRMVQFLCHNGANPRALTSEGKTPLHLAASHRVPLDNYLELVNFLVEATPDQLEKGDCDGKTPLHCATWGDPKPQVIQVLLNAGALPNARNSYRYTPLHWTAKHGHQVPTTLLLNAGADDGLKNANEETPFDLAINWGQDEIFRIFLNHNFQTKQLSNQSSIAASSSHHFPMSSPSQNSSPTCSSHTSPSTSTTQGNSLEDEYYQQFIEAYKLNNPIDQFFYLEKIASVEENRDLIKAANFLNSALALAQKYNLHPQCPRYLTTRLERLEGLFLKETFNVMTPAEHHGYILEQRRQLAEIREKVNDRLAHNEPIEKVLADLTEDYKRLLAELIKNSINLIGKDPHPHFSIIGIGAMAKGEMCPYSDLQFAIIVQESTPEILEYFQKLSRFLQLRLMNFGETRWEIIPPQEKEDGTMSEPVSFVPQGYCMNLQGLSPLGKLEVYNLICTPKELAGYQSRTWLDQNEEVTALANATQSTHLMGEIKLSELYQKELNERLYPRKLAISRTSKTRRNQRKERAIALLDQIVKEFKPSLTMEGIAFRVLDIKQEFYYPFETMIRGLLLFYGFKSRGTLEGITRLKEKKLISAAGANHLTSAFRAILLLRAQAHFFYKNDHETIFNPLEEEIIDREKLFLMTKKESKPIMEIYRTLIPLRAAIESFLANPKLSLSQFPFYDENLGR